MTTRTLSRKSFFIQACLLLILIFPFRTYADGWNVFQQEESDHSFPGKEGLVSLLIDNKVSVISGEYVDAQEDLTLVGPEPLRWQRCYSSNPSACSYGIDSYIPSRNLVRRGSHHCNWQFNYATGMYLQFETNGHARHVEATALVPHLSSANMVHKSLVSNKNDCCHILLDERRGITNCAMREISAKTNPRNVIATFDDIKKECKVIFGDGSYKEYAATAYERYNNPDNNFIMYELVPCYEKKPNGCQIIYKRDEVRACNPTSSTIFGWIKFFLLAANKIKVESSHFDPIIYTYEPLDVYLRDPGNQKTFFYLKHLSRPDQPDESFDYVKNSQQSGWLLKRKDLPQNRFLEIEYNSLGDVKNDVDKTTISSSIDPCLDRVKCLKAPVGRDASPIITHRIFYDVNYKKKKKAAKTYNGTTTVYDALNRKSTYTYNSVHLLTSYKQFSNASCYKETKYLWQLTRLPPMISHLMGKIELNECEQILCGSFFKYDKRGNIISNRFYGNLTGTCAVEIQLGNDRFPLENVEYFEKTYRYSNDAFNLLMEIHAQNGKRISYQYIPGTNLISQKLLMQNEHIIGREFYEYDENNTLVTLIRDNGSSSNSNDLNQVTTRRVTYFSPRKTIPIGLFEQIEERALDVTSGKQILIRRTIQEFSKEGRLTKQKIYDANNQYRYELSWEYDRHGNVIKETNALNHQVLRKYDDNDNLIQEYHVEGSYVVDYTYDFANRLIKEKHSPPDGETYRKHYKYDLVGNKTSEIDRYGNKTKFVYDDLNRLIKVIEPAIQLSQEIGTPTKKFEYDVQGNVTKEINQNGFATEKSYNSRGQITRILQPDGQLDRFEYYLDGSLAKKIASNGMTTYFEVDCFGRILRESLFDSTGQFIYETLNKYDSFQQISSTDPTGLTTYFFYDPAGRLIKKTCADKIENYTYDSLGRLSKKSEPYEKGIKVTCYEYDLLDRMIEERIENAAGIILQQRFYQYDIWGNRTHVIEEITAGKSITQTIFNADKKIIQITDPEGNNTHISYDYRYVNHLNQRVLQTKKVDCLGRQTLVTHNVHEKPVQIILKNAFGKVLQSQEITYDTLGNVIGLIDHEILDGKEIKTIETTFEYQSTGQLCRLIRAKNLSEQQKTDIFYNSFGQKERVLKPDGTILYYTYDALGRLDTYRSDDQTLSYNYTYNNRNQVVKVNDLIHQAVSSLSYDAKGRMIKESLSNGLSIIYLYDLLDRVISIQLPNNNLIAYEYNECYLKHIKRYKNKKLVYTHSYEHHDLAGQNLSAKTIDKRKIHYAYDLSKRLLTSQSPAYTQNGQYDSFGRLVNVQVQDALGEFSSSFDYNDLDQLISENGEHSHTYICDSLYRRIYKDKALSKFNALHQLLNDNVFNYEYDASGNLAKKQHSKKKTLYSYDADNQLTGIQGDKSISYSYDAFHRRLVKVENGKKMFYLYIGQDEIGTLNESGEIVELRILGEHPGTQAKVSVAIELGEKVYVPYYDFQGSLVALTDLNGICLETYRYSAFGETVIYDANKNKVTQSSLKNPWQFSNKRFDIESGFIYFGRRYYDPQNGRWITADPAGMVDGTNLYAYLKHKPIGSWDLYGLFEQNQDSEASTCYPLENVDLNDSPRDHDVALDANFPEFDGANLRLKRSGKTGKSYCCGHIENKNISFLTVHGIMNTLRDAFETAFQRSKDLNGVKIHFVFNESQGIMLDLLRCAGELFLHMETNRVLNARTEIKNLLGATPYVFVEPHSEGGIVSRNAIRGLSREEQMRILLVGYACAAYLNSQEVLKAKYYRSERDIVPYSDLAGLIRCSDLIEVLKPHRDAPLFDHTISSLTYRGRQKEETLKALKTYGGEL